MALSAAESRRIRDEVVRQCDDFRRRSISRDNYCRNSRSLRAHHRVEVVESFRNPNGFPIPHVLLSLTVAKFWRLRSQIQVETIFSLCRYYDIAIVCPEADTIEDFIGPDHSDDTRRTTDSLQVIRANLPLFHGHVARELGLDYDAIVEHVTGLEAAAAAAAAAATSSTSACSKRESGKLKRSAPSSPMQLPRPPPVYCRAPPMPEIIIKVFSSSSVHLAGEEHVRVREELLGSTKVDEY